MIGVDIIGYAPNTICAKRHRRVTPGTGEDDCPLPWPAHVAPYGCPKLYHDGFVFCALGAFALVPTKSLSADLYA